MSTLLDVEIENLKSNNSYFTAKEIDQQSSIWFDVIDNLILQKQNIKGYMDNIKNIKGLRVILTGAGTSAYAGEVCSPYLSTMLGYPVEAIATTDIVSTPNKYLYSDIPTLLISFARSGNSPESVACVNLAEKIVNNLYQIVITCNENGKLAKKDIKTDKDLLVVLPSETNDKGFAMTSSFTSMILSCIGVFNINSIDKLKGDIELLSKSTNDFIQKDTTSILNLANTYYDRVVYLGSAELKGISKESSLKLLELTNGVINATYETPLAFRHGPKSVVKEDTLIAIYLSNEPYTRQYDLDLIDELLREKNGYKVVVIGSNIPQRYTLECDYTFNLDSNEYNVANEVLFSLQCIIFGQLISFHKAYKMGITVDNPCPSGEVNRVVKGVTIYDYKK